MKSAQKRIFRIERINPLTDGEVTELTAEETRHNEIMAALKDVHAKMANGGSAGGEVAANPMDSVFLAEFKKELEDARNLRSEMSKISDSITETKREIATLHHSSFSENTDVQLANELDAVVVATETATDTILNSVESIDNTATDLAAQLAGTEQEGMVMDIQEQTIKVFEACNFQDLTGQRVQKVLDTLKYIEAHIDNMIEIWGGLENFLDISPETLNKKTGDDMLLNGPGLEDDGEMRSSQDDIDSLFD